MADLIKLKKGPQANLPNLNLAEPAFTTDEERLYIGGLNGNVPLPNKQDIDTINSHLADIAINVKNFGAKGDGITDDTLAIRNAIDYATNTLSNSVETKYAIGFKLEFPAGRYRVTDTITLTKSINSISGITGRGFQIILEGVGQNTSIELDKTDGILFNVFDVSVVFKDLSLWAMKGNSTVMVAGKDDPVNLYEVRQSRFSNVFFRGNTCIKVNRMFDSSFYDCFFALTGTNGIAIDVIKPTFDNSNNLNFRRCHFENGSTNGTWIRARGDDLRGDGFHHGFNFDGCHFETRAYSMKILDLYNVNSFSFYRCQFTQNRKSDLSDTVADAVNLILLEQVASITFDACIISRQGDISTAPLLIKAVGICNAVTFRNVFSPICGDGTGGRGNFIDDSECTTKRGIKIDNCMLTSITNKSSNNDRLFLSESKIHNRDWQMFTNNQNLLLGYTIDSAKDILVKGDEQFGYSRLGQFKANNGFTGTNVSLDNASTYSFMLPSAISANRRALYMFNMSVPTADCYGIVSMSATTLVTVILGAGVVNGGTSNPDTANKLNVWVDTATGSLNFKNNLGSTYQLMIIPFAFGDMFN